MQIHYNGKEIELPEGSSGKDLAEKCNLREPHQSLALSLNGVLKDLSHPIQDGDTVHLVNFDEAEGKELFWHSSAHVLAQAVLRLYPEAKPTIGPPIENGFYYDFANLTISEEDFPKIEKEIQAVLKEGFRPECEHFTTIDEALKAFKDNPYKCELIKGFEEGSPITAYRQGEFFDLCRGPHLSTLGKIKAFKLLKTSGAYWRGDSSREMLTRIYGISFPDRKLLKEYLTMLEEAKKRDHRLIGSKLNLYSFREEAPGMPFFHPKGMELWHHLTQFWRETHKDANYEIILTPQLMTKELWEKSGHWEHYRENMFTSETEEREYAVKPMNCPGCMLYYKGQSHSYRELPLRVAEFGHVHRKEPSGAIGGLFRVQSFHQDDAHVFMTPLQIKGEILEVLRLVETIYGAFGLTHSLELSTRPEKSIGTDEDWEMATAGLQEALDEWGKPYKINEGDGAFYGPKIDIHIQDAIGRRWQCGTIQLDMALPEKFELEYMDSDGIHKRPVMIHRAIFGSIERFMGILVEHFAGRFPLWLSPLPVRLLTVADRHIDYAKKVAAKLRSKGFTCDIDDAGESVSKKVRNAQLQQINYMLTIGDQEVEKETLSVRTRDNVVHSDISPEKFIETLTKERETQSLGSLFAKEAK